MDLIWEYNIWIKEEDKWKVVFLTNKDLFKPQIMYFGLYNLLGTFQRMMNSIFLELLDEGVLANYIDDFVILAKTKKELKEQIIQFFKIVEKHNLCFKKSKCDFNIEEILILEVVVGWEQVQIENNKVKAVKEWSTPTKVKEVESFLEFVNFYRRFIKNFSYMAKPLNKLKEKKEWNWTDKHQKAFKELKEKITSQLVLFLLRKEGKFRLETNASKHAIGEVLFQEQEEKWKPIVFFKNNATCRKKLWNIWQNSTRENEMIKELKKEDKQTWEDNGIIYVDGSIYIPNNKKIQEQVL